MTLGPVLAVLLSALATSGAEASAPAPRGEGVAAPAPAREAAPGAEAAPDGGDGPDGDATPEEEDAGDEASGVPVGTSADAPEGAPLSESAPLLLDRTERDGGWALERLLEPSGDVVEHLVNRAGTVQSCRKVGSLFTLRVIEQRAAAGGETLEVVRDGSGALLRLAIGKDGEPRAVALLAPPPR